MRLFKTDKQTLKQRGFTIIEVIVVLPIASFIAITITYFMIRIFTYIEVQNQELSLRLESQVILYGLEDELLFSTSYGETSSSDLNDPSEPSGGWDADTDPGTLIIYETSLDAPRRIPDRDFVRKEVYSCASGYSVYNPIAIDNVIYFTEPNPNDDYYTLYRRILTPQYSTCGTNYRGQTCPTEAGVGLNGCVKTDGVLSRNVADFELTYYDENNNVIPVSGSTYDAERVKVTLTLGDDVYGNDISGKSSITMRKIN